MLPPRDQSATLIDSGEFKADRFAFRPLPITWEDDFDDDEEGQKDTNMIEVPTEDPSSGLLRVLPAVPSVWTPPPPSRATAPSNPVLTRPCEYEVANQYEVANEPCQPHWVPEPPPPRVSFPSAGSFTTVAPLHAPPPRQQLVMAELIDPHGAITLATPRTIVKRERASKLSRKVILPWPAALMVMAVAGGVVFEHVQAGDTRSTIASVLMLAHASH